MATKLTVSRIHIRNILGIEDLEVRPGALTVVEGANGAGKTSVLEAIKALVGGGHDATLLRAGADAGEIVMELSSGVVATKRVTEKGSTLTVTHPEGGQLGKPQGFINSLVDALGFNPVAFLSADDKRRLEYLLESMPLQVTPDMISAAMGEVEIDDPYFRVDEHALQVIDRYRRAAYDARTGLNRAAREKAATVSELGGSVPVDSADVQELRERARVNAELSATHAFERDQHRKSIREWRETEIERVRQEAERAIAEVRAQAERRVADYDAVADGRRTQLDQEAAELRTAMAEAERHANTRGVLEKLRGEVEDLELRAAQATAAIQGLGKLKAELIRTLPLPGVTIEDGQILVEGVPFNRLNTAARVKLALNIAGQRARSAGLPLVCVDGLECLDEETFAAFKAKAPRSGLQLVVTRVGSGELTVTPIAEEVAA